MTEVLVAFPLSEPQRARLMEAGGGRCRFVFTDETGEEKRAALERAEVVIGNLTEEELAAAPRLRWLQTTWSGVDRYAKMASFPPHVVLTNTTGAFGVMIAEHVVGAMLIFCRGYLGYFRNQQVALWHDEGRQKTLEGKTALILGAGDIGTKTAERLKAFGMHLIGVRRSEGAAFSPFDELYTCSDLDALLPRADFVICCLPDTPDTRELLDGARLRRMKPDAVLVNVGRGSLIVTDDLAEVLREGGLYGAALDVTDPEPLPPEHPLWQMPNVLITPHVAGCSSGHLGETEEKIVSLVCENLRRYFTGEKLQNVVDLALGYRPAEGPACAKS